MRHRNLLESAFNAVISAAQPKFLRDEHFPKPPKGRVVVLWAGKGVAQVARAFERVWDGPLEGLVVTRCGYAVPCEPIEVVEAAHPIPDRTGLNAAHRMLMLAESLTAYDLLIALITGGGSAFLPAHPVGLSLRDEQALCSALLSSGAPISDMNCVRKHFSEIKGGRLALAAYPAKKVSYIVSDIPGDDLSLVPSGPTIPNSSTRQDALKMVNQYGLKLPAAVLQHLNTATADAADPTDARFKNNLVNLLASPQSSLDAASEIVRSNDIQPWILSDAIEGEAREIGKMHTAMAKHILGRDQPMHKPVCLISGGETTVTLKGSGRGGPNTEFLLSLTIAIDGTQGIDAFAADTDGIDGSGNNAGAFADGTTCARPCRMGLNAKDFLLNNDAYSAFEHLNDLFVPGSTGTNVNDFRAVIVQ